MIRAFRNRFGTNFLPNEEFVAGSGGVKANDIVKITSGKLLPVAATDDVVAGIAVNTAAENATAAFYEAGPEMEIDIDIYGATYSGGDINNVTLFAHYDVHVDSTKGFYLDAGDTDAGGILKPIAVFVSVTPDYDPADNTVSPRPMARCRFAQNAVNQAMVTTTS